MSKLETYEIIEKFLLDLKLYFGSYGWNEFDKDYKNVNKIFQKGMDFVTTFGVSNDWNLELIPDQVLEFTIFCVFINPTAHF